MRAAQAGNWGYIGMMENQIETTIERVGLSITYSCEMVGWFMAFVGA